MGLVHRKDHRTWGLYTKYTICMLPMLLHDVCTICTISSYEIGTILCLIVTVNMKLYFIQISRWLLGFLISLVHICFFAFLCPLHFGFSAINDVTIEAWLQPPLTANLTCIGDLRLQLRIFHWYMVSNWYPHLSVEIFKFFTTAKPLLNNVFYKMQLF